MTIISLLLLASLLPHLTFTALVDVGIVNGKEAKPHSRPYMVSLQINGHHHCCGFLISDEFVMTAAHCQKGILGVLWFVETLQLASCHSVTVNAVIHLTHVKVGIVNGTEAKPHSRPYMVSIQLAKTHICGGFFISDEFVLTAAHCWKRSQTLTVVVGAHDLRLSKNRIGVKSYIQHPSYVSHFNWNDIMLLRGDSGGPLVCGNTAVGVTSFGYKPHCNDPEKPNVYIKISPYIQWINDIISNVHEITHPFLKILNIQPTSAYF
ncbi:mast cell protease 1A-like protein [Labeo rohita]|uniref:trypsin n=1 Tax=Labeo rohita TaxID=84645 RepID=A0A498NH52_LABRO|nr:mast cell protease 1A-like protein [Labeo rohita]